MKKAALYALLAANVAAIAFLWWSGSGSLWPLGTSGKMIAVGRLAGLFLEFFILLQLVLIGRIVWVEQIFGHDKLNRLHRFIGQAIVALLLSHPLLLSLGYGHENGYSFIKQLFDFIYNWEDVGKAALAVVLLILVILFSIAIVRKKLRYETWHGIHFLTYLAVALAFGHQINTADVATHNPLHYWLALNFLVFGLVLFYRWIKPLWQAWHFGFFVERIILEAPDVVSLYISGQSITNYKFQAGQFANLTFLSKKHFFTHPFSFSAAPGQKEIRFSIKASGDFTNKISDLPLKTRVVIDGPLGQLTQKASSRNKYLLLGGGIGITPLRALAEELSNKSRDTILIYGARTPNDLIFKNELEKLKIKIFFLLSRSKEKPAANFEHGRMNHEKISRLVPDFLQREIYLCGPDEMIVNVKRELIKSGISKKQIHFERFAY